MLRAHAAAQPQQSDRTARSSASVTAPSRHEEEGRSRRARSEAPDWGGSQTSRVRDNRGESQPTGSGRTVRAGHTLIQVGPGEHRIATAEDERRAQSGHIFQTRQGF